MERERYDRRVRHPFSPNVVVIDHISYCMDSVQEDLWFSWLIKTLPPTSGEYRKPHLTVAYSPTEIKEFPNIDFEGELTLNLDPKYQVSMSVENRPIYDIFVDPFGKRHVVFRLNHPVLWERHSYFLTVGGTWTLGEYDPFIILETNTEHTIESLKDLPNLDRKWVFNMIRFTRFGEYVY